MSKNFFDFTPSDPIADLPTEILERAMTLRNGLVAMCEGRNNMNDAVYRLLRREFMVDPATADMLPKFVRIAQDTGAMWALLKDHSPQWAPRRQFVRDQFMALIDGLERGQTLKSGKVVDDINSSISSNQWEKPMYSELNLRTSIEQSKIKIRLEGATAMKKQAEETRHVTNVTIHGHGNAVQAGIHQSTVGLKFNSSTIQDLTAAFEELRNEIDKSDAPLELKAELIGVTNDCKTELEKPTPNRIKFTGLLGGLASGIQTIASLKGAWEMFKAAAFVAGIDIP